MHVECSTLFTNGRGGVTRGEGIVTVILILFFNPMNVVKKVSDHVASLVFAMGTLRANVWTSVRNTTACIYGLASTIPQRCSHCP